MLRTIPVYLTLLVTLNACPWPIPPGDVPPVVQPEDPPSGCSGESCEEPEQTCLFGDTFHELYDNPAFELSPDEWIRDEAALTDELERAQLVSAVQQSSHTDVTTVAEALARVDEQEVRRVWFTHRESGREYVAYEYGAGDNSYGAYFVRGELPVVAQIHDGDLYECSEFAN
jgi:hypothetical protein